MQNFQFKITVLYNQYKIAKFPNLIMKKLKKEKKTQLRTHAYLICHQLLQQKDYKFFPKKNKKQNTNFI